MKWTLIVEARGGHKLFEAEGSTTIAPKWAIADRSGKYPHQTDDGPLWVDFARIRENGYLAVGGIGKRDGLYIYIPVYKTQPGVEDYFTAVAYPLARRIAGKVGVAIRYNDPHAGMIGIVPC